MRSFDIKRPMLSESIYNITKNPSYDQDFYTDLKEWVSVTEQYHGYRTLTESSGSNVDIFFNNLAQYKLAKKAGIDLAGFTPVSNEPVSDKLKSKAEKAYKKIAAKLKKMLDEANKKAQAFADLSPEELEAKGEELKKEFEKKFNKLSSKLKDADAKKILAALKKAIDKAFPEGWYKDKNWWKKFGKKVLPMLGILAVSVAVGSFAGPWAARLSSIALKAGISYIKTGSVDWKTMAVGAGIGAVAGEITELFGDAAEETVDAVEISDTDDVGDYTEADAMADKFDEIDFYSGEEIQKIASKMKELAAQELATGGEINPTELSKLAIEQLYDIDVNELGRVDREIFDMQTTILLGRIADGDLSGGNWSGNVSIIGTDWADKLGIEQSDIDAGKDVVVEKYNKIFNEVGIDLDAGNMDAETLGAIRKYDTNDLKALVELKNDGDINDYSDIIGKYDPSHVKYVMSGGQLSDPTSLGSHTPYDGPKGETLDIKQALAKIDAWDKEYESTLDAMGF